MPLTKKGNKIMAALRSTYHSEKKAEQVFYASRNAGKITGVDPESRSPRHAAQRAHATRKRRKA